MAAVVQVYHYVEVEIKGRPIRMGSLQTPRTITLGDDEVMDRTKSVVNNTTWDVWDGSDIDNEALADFDFLAIESDQDVFVELTTDQNNGTGKEEYVIEVSADIPWFLTSDDGKALYTADFAAGTDDLIDQIRVRNESGSAAIVRVLAMS